MVVGTESGRLLWLDNALLHGTLRDSPNNGKSVDSIVSFHEGKMFAIGGDDGVLRTYIRDEKEQFTLARTFNIDQHTSKIKSIAISPGDDDLVVSLDTNQAFTLKGFRTDVLKPADMKFEPLGGVLNHTGPITGLDICVRKPIIVTCGADKTVRVWNYMTKSVELAVPFSETPYSVALHPSGLHLLVGFADKLRLMNILMDDIKMSREFPVKMCTECQFSNGGQWFAAVHSGYILILHLLSVCLFMSIINEYIG
jgi:WD40 repeat protein